MNLEATVKFLKGLQAQNIQPTKRSGWVISRCPLEHWRHDDGKSGAEVFGMRVEPGNARGNCFSCGWHGSMSDLLLTMRHLNKAQPAVIVEWSKLLEIIEQAEADEDFIDFDTPGIEEMLVSSKPAGHVFPDWWLTSFVRWQDAGLAKSYLQSRGVPPSIATEMDIRFDSSEKRVCFPIRDFKGTLLGLHGRALHKETEPRYRMYTHAGKNNPDIWLGEHWVDRSKPIVVVEGPFDVAAVKRVYPNVVSPQFASPGFPKIRRMQDALDWVTLLDRGKGGDVGRSRIEAALTKDHMVTHLFPPEGRKDPGESTPEELLELLKGHVPLS